MILKCKCNHAYQDQIYGNENRIHNKAKGPNNTVEWRCTVCGNVRTDVSIPRKQEK